MPRTGKLLFDYNPFDISNEKLFNDFSSIINNKLKFMAKSQYWRYGDFRDWQLTTIKEVKDLFDLFSITILDGFLIYGLPKKLIIRRYEVYTEPLHKNHSSFASIIEEEKIVYLFRNITKTWTIVPLTAKMYERYNLLPQPFKIRNEKGFDASLYINPDGTINYDKRTMLLKQYREKREKPRKKKS